MNEPFKVLEKDGMSYVELDWRRGDTRINGEKAVACPGNDKWAMVEGKIASMEHVRQVQGEVTGFRLAERYRNLVDLPETQPLDAFEQAVDCKGIIGELAEFYEVVRAEPAEETEVLEFQVIDLDCEPVKMPDYVKVKFPGNLKQYPQTWHKCPCSIPYATVFNLLYDRVAEVVGNSNGRYERDNYKSIQTLHVWEKIRANFPTERFTLSQRGSGASKATYRVCEVTILRVVGEYKGDAVHIETVHGENYEDLQQKLEEYIQGFLSLFEDVEREVCPRCEGAGIVEVKK